MLVRSLVRSDGRKIHPSVLKDIVPFGSAAQKDQSESEEELVRERTNQRAAFGQEEELAMERTNQRTAFNKEELALK